MIIVPSLNVRTFASVIFTVRNPSPPLSYEYLGNGLTMTQIQVNEVH